MLGLVMPHGNKGSMKTIGHYWEELLWQLADF